ncbi:DUF594 family protein [Melia azedarach]|uniref:DUF594 family protein n=1 Tax=Melia azedarach TaxID=155640 RepID=A0ACC1Y501_MELAZ|nr:DUF594 family protein [Melia azedarach]
MGQFNLVSFCIKEKLSQAASITKLFGASPSVDLGSVSFDLQKLIFTELMEKIEKHENYQPFCSNPTGQRLLAQRGDYVLEDKYMIHDADILWLTGSASYDCSLLAWHIATDLCYYDDVAKHCNGNPENVHPSCKISKCLSEYVQYLMVLCPTMMPEGFSDSRYTQTCKEVKSFFAKKIAVMKKKTNEPRQIFLQQKLDDSTVQTRVNSHLSVFKSGCWLGKQLQLLESKEDWDYERKWKMISEVWVEILGYTASHCAWNVHGQYLRRGGELLTHVCLLVAHLGLNSQYGFF